MATVEYDFDALYRVLRRTIYAFFGSRHDVADDAPFEAFARAIRHADGIRTRVRGCTGQSSGS